MNQDWLRIYCSTRRLLQQPRDVGRSVVHVEVEREAERARVRRVYDRVAVLAEDRALNVRAEEDSEEEEGEWADVTSRPVSSNCGAHLS